MKILLVKPDQPAFKASFKGVMMIGPLSLETVAGALDDHDVRILDMRVDPGLDEKIASFEPDVVGTTSLATDSFNALEVLRRAKEIDPSIFTLVGGTHVLFRTAEFDRPFIDAVVVGEGERTVQDLAEALDRKQDYRSIPGIAVPGDGPLRLGAERPFAEDLDELPMPRGDLTQKYRTHYRILVTRGLGQIETGRGCLFRCNFCSIWRKYGSTYRKKSPERIVAELERIPQENVCVVDDHFLQDTEGSRQMFEAILASGLKKRFFCQARTDAVVKNRRHMERWAEAGLSQIFLGLEAVDDGDLKGFNKASSMETTLEAVRIMKTSGIDAYGSIIVKPEFEEPDFARIEEFIERVEVRSGFSVLTPFPGTEEDLLYSDRKKEIITEDPRLYDGMHSVFRTRLPRDQFYKNFGRVQKKMFLQSKLFPADFYDDLLSSEDPEEIFRLIKGLKGLSSYRSYLHDESMVMGPEGPGGRDEG